MNTGLQDAYNLDWKLALVVSGVARPALLDSYADERVPVAQRLLRTTDQGFRSSCPAAGSPGCGGPAFCPGFSFAIPTGRSEMLPGLPADAPRAGDRLPWLHLRLSANGPVEDLHATLDDTRFTLLLFGRGAPPGEPPALGGLLRTQVIPADPANDQELARAGIPRPAFYLLRPDGHVGLCGTTLQAPALARYVSERLHVG